MPPPSPFIAFDVASSRLVVPVLPFYRWGRRLDGSNNFTVNQFRSVVPRPALLLLFLCRLVRCSIAVAVVQQRFRLSSAAATIVLALPSATNGSSTG